MTDQAQTLFNIPVVFMSVTTADAVMAAADPVAALAAQAFIFPSGTNNIRLRIHVLSSVPGDVERVAEIGTEHGYWSGQPVVPKSDGSGYLNTPATDVTKDGSAVGTTAQDWLDTPPTGYAAYGLWVFDQYAGFIIQPHGVTCGLPLQIRGTGLTVSIVAGVNAFDTGAGCAAWIGPTVAAPPIDLFQAALDNNPQTTASDSTQADSTQPTYSVTLRMVTVANFVQPYADIFCRITMTQPAAGA